MANKIKNYSNYQLFDFLLDADFKNWILHPDDDLNAYWREVSDRYPEQRQLIEKATQLVRNLPVAKQQPTTDRSRKLWDRIEEEITVAPVTVHHSSKLKPYLLRYTKYAAILVAVVGGFVLIRNATQTRKITVATGNGENKEVILPDGSMVQLAPNSSVSWYSNINDQSQREVWAQGEAEFTVKHINQHPQLIKKGERFVVHLPQSIDVRVLGTVFNITERRGEAAVYLKSGSVRITRNKQELLLQPGESAVTNKLTRELRLDKSIPKLQHEWENHILILNKTKISTILRLINDSYGVRLTVEDPLLLNRDIDGAIPLDDLEKALRILSSVTGTEVVKADGHISLKK